MNAHRDGGSDGGSASHISRRSRLRYVIVALVGTVLVLTAALSWILHDVRFPSAAEVTSRRVIALKSADGQDLFHEGHARLPPVEAKEMPVDVVNAVLSIEDRRFYQHDGVDLRSVLRALEQNIRSGKTVAGGSTITQQLVKISFSVQSAPTSAKSRRQQSRSGSSII